jgi:hypothetical protein
MPSNTCTTRSNRDSFQARKESEPLPKPKAKSTNAPAKTQEHPEPRQVSKDKALQQKQKATEEAKQRKSSNKKISFNLLFYLGVREKAAAIKATESFLEGEEETPLPSTSFKSSRQFSDDHF